MIAYDQALTLTPKASNRSLMMHVTGFLVISVAAACSPASADEIWACNMPEAWSGAPVASRFEARGKYLVEMGMPHRAYDIIVDNRVAIVSAWGVGYDSKDAPDVKAPQVGAEIFAIDRKSGASIRGIIALNRRGPTLHGTCHLERP